MEFVIDENFHPHVMYSLYNQTHSSKWYVDRYLAHWTVTLLQGGLLSYALDEEKFVLRPGQLLFTAPAQYRIIKPIADGVKLSCLDFYTPNHGEAGYKIFNLSATSSVNYMIGEITKERMSRHSYNQQMIDSLAMQIVVRLMRITAGEQNGAVEKMKMYVIENYMHPLSAEELGFVVGLSPSYCGKLFKKYEGCSIPAYIMRIRLNVACERFSSGDTSIHSVAMQCGFCDEYHFSKVFKAHIGKSPSAYIKELK
ncbi:MAG: AraC family transcriptional regulator [Clostridia bacterium]|nr:AraC family transcriptional regulator [Clostridia bacterium]